MEDEAGSLAAALKEVLAHALGALEQEDLGNFAQSLEEYCDAHQALSCALELHGGGSADLLPPLLRDTCAALLETYSCRYESIRARLMQQPDSGGDPQALATGSTCQLGDVGRPCPGSPHNECATEAYGQYGTTRCVPESYEDRVGPAGNAARCEDGTSRRRVASVQPPPAGPGCSGVRGDAPRAACAASGSGSGECGGEAAGGAPAAADGSGLSEVMAEVLRQCQRPVAAGGSLDELAGLGPVKEEVRMALLLPARMPHLFRGIRQPPRNFLLHGPPGTGKTMLVERIAAEAGATLLVVTPSAVLSKWSGESEKQLRAVFEVARALPPPCLVFMDVDPALLRRFDRRVAVPLPDAAARAAYLRAVLLRPELAGHRLGGADVAELAGLTEGYSGSDLSQLCREAAMQPVRELLRRMAEAEAEEGAAQAAAASAAAAASTPSSRDPQRPPPHHQQQAAAGGRRALRSGGGGGGEGRRGSSTSAPAAAAGEEMGALLTSAQGAPRPAPLAMRPLERRDFEAALATIRPVGG
ncbi:Katanin p60 ATPase-containing subunit A-like 2 [Tetrabaena socialis]|uniref:Katanin p60 ATPase-containing subunit A-like 2 n=1 Tax=Tetrabaena socialis TaxID=47790 RepID=A0A2J8ACZ5_9CHLO|nr:Katanin p60 ATPase-containing subunit A-like 2 [Tetrabaena socialis]|eukprot:PNH10395.1 Katanin p60 ATPase-containing subunit A-like 2 [Tetrabaena socialis]